MVGQKNLLNKLNSYTIDTFPHTTLFLGEEGSGKHLMSAYVASEILKLPMYDITENIEDTYITEIYKNPNPGVYLIDLRKLQTFYIKGQIVNKESNVLLKFIEEPPSNCFVVLLANNGYEVLNTVYNRCFVFNADLYTEDELRAFTQGFDSVDLILKVVRTPGRIQNLNLSKITDLFNLCNNIVDSMSRARFDNALSLKDRINYKDEQEKYDLNLFLDVLSQCFLDRYKINNNPTTFKMYLILNNERKHLVDRRIKKEYFVECLLTKLWKESRV